MLNAEKIPGKVVTCLQTACLSSHTTWDPGFSHYLNILTSRFFIKGQLNRQLYGPLGICS